MLASSLMLVAVPQFYYSVFFGRLIAGVGCGFGYVAVNRFDFSILKICLNFHRFQLIQHFGEIAIDSQRGRIGTSIHLFNLKGGIVSGSAVIRFFAVEGRMDVNRFLGIFSLIFSLLAIATTIAFYKESPLQLIREGKEVEALRTMLILSGRVEETAEITKSLDDCKAMVQEERHLSAGVFEGRNIKPLVIVFLLKFAFVLTFNYALKSILHARTRNSNIDYTFVLNLVHTSTVLFMLFTIDKGRRIHFLISGFGTSLILIVFGVLRANISGFLVFIVLVAFELFSALGIGLTAVTYSTEIFCSPKKPGSIAFTGILESCLQILFVFMTENFNAFDAVLLLFSGSILGLITTFALYKLPETANISIREAQNKFL